MEKRLEKDEIAIDMQWLEQAAESEDFWSPRHADVTLDHIADGAELQKQTTHKWEPPEFVPEEAEVLDTLSLLVEKVQQYASSLRESK